MIFDGKSDKTHIWGYFTECIYEKKFIMRVIDIYTKCSTSKHYHKKQDELYCVISGEIIVEIEERKYILKENQFIFIERGKKHRVTGSNVNDRTSKYVEIVTGNLENSINDVYRIEEAKGGEIFE